MGSQLTRGVFPDKLVAAEVAYAVLTPPDWTPAERLPLILVLHGANSSSDLLAALQPLVDALAGPRSVVACAATPTIGGFYLNQAAGGDAWESLIAEAFPRLLVARYGVDPDNISLLGASMGGYGALKIAFADPARFTSVAAISPALLPAGRPADLRPRNTLSVLANLGEEMDAAGFTANSVPHRLHANATAIRASGLPILLRCGDHDVFKMHDGTEQLHRALWDLDIAHDYHLVRGADHIGPEATASQHAAFAFVAAAQHVRAGTDRSPADRELETAWQDWVANGRQGAPPRLDHLGATGPAALRILLESELAENARQDPTATRRYGLLS